MNFTDFPGLCKYSVTHSVTCPSPVASLRWQLPVLNSTVLRSFPREFSVLCTGVWRDSPVTVTGSGLRRPPRRVLLTGWSTMPSTLAGFFHGRATLAFVSSYVVSCHLSVCQSVSDNAQPGCTSVNASCRQLPAVTHHSRPRRLARSYLVRLFHSLPFSGLRRRTLTPLPSPKG